MSVIWNLFEVDDDALQVILLDNGYDLLQALMPLGGIGASGWSSTSRRRSTRGCARSWPTTSPGAGKSWATEAESRGMTLSIDTADVPTFDISDPFFSASSAAVAAAREQSWWARTNFGLHRDGLNTSLTEIFLNSGIGNGASNSSINRIGLERLQKWVGELKPPAYPFAIDHPLADLDRTGADRLETGDHAQERGLAAA